MSSNGKQRDRTIYDENGVMKTQIHGGGHGRPKLHPYGERGEHIHDYRWMQGSKTPERTTRDASAEELIAHSDILGGEDDDS